MAPKKSEAQRSTEAITDLGGEAVGTVVLEAIDGPGAGLRVELPRGTATLGSDPSCDVVLEDPAVSRKHARLEQLVGAVRVRDLESRNGTFYLGARLDEARVPLGATVRVGRTTVRFLSAGKQAAAPLSDRTELGGLIGSSAAMRQLFARIERLAPTDSTVLIRGETGVGKESVARALHALSGRAGGPWVVFDCAAVSAELMESQLFGHAQGAFTGADRARRGALEAAEGGTFFLDEIGDLPLRLQPLLLRVLEARELKRLGETHYRKVSVRVLAATHQNLEKEVEAGRFRRDLLHRLGLTLSVPALRERRDDIAPLAERFARELGGVDLKLSADTLVALQCHDWPGNVRELRNAVDRIAHFGALEPSPPRRAPREKTFLEARDELMRSFEHDYLTALLKKHRGNVSAVARESKLSRSQLYRLLRTHGLVQG
ncbi:MAG: sigma 54-dependent Fis family transcriptional regulator [Archangiaceae bacterium]|nr:sigma 54-dependent Fis family transcriptional regulator [Archangiaceae bacterium]